MKILLTEKECCGCGLCEAVCPRYAIVLQRDGNGFWKPVIDTKKCIECGLCQQNCVIEQADKLKGTSSVVYGAMHKNDRIRKESTSGGAFSSFAEVILKEDGVVYGAAYVNGTIKHIRVESIQEVRKLRGSKYAQSDIRSVFDSLRDDLGHGRKVLFSGTPCQCAAIKKYVQLKRIKADTLFLVDFICHGVVSSKILEDYIEYCEKKANKKIKEHYFRYKINGWENHIEANLFEDNMLDYKSFESQIFKSFFYSHLGLQKSCFSCRFASENRASDITMADFWGLKESYPEKYDEKGVSLCMINSDQGRTLFHYAQEYLTVFPASIENTKQPQLKKPVNMPEKYDEFWNIYKKGFDKAAVKYFHAGKLRRGITDIVKYILHR